MAQRNTFISKAEYAKRIGVHRSQISRYVKAGMPTHNGLIEPDEADWWREQHLDPTKPKSKVTTPQQRKAQVEKAAAQIDAAAAAPKKPSPTPGSPPASEDGQPDDTPNLTTARAWDTHFSAENRKRLMLKHDREHIPLLEVEVVWDAANVAYRQGLEGVAGRTASIIAAMTGGDAARIEEIIRDEHRTALATVADIFEKAAIIAETGGAFPSSDGNSETT
jgi:hypothetical protein